MSSTSDFAIMQSQVLICRHASSQNLFMSEVFQTFSWHCMW